MIIDKTIVQPTAPESSNVLWLNSEEGKLRYSVNGEWADLSVGSGTDSAPIFNAEITEESEKIVVSMSEEDRYDIYNHKYPVIGIHLLDEEENDVVLYFKIRIESAEANAVVYDNWDGGDGEISQMELTFMWDGDDVKIIFDTNDYSGGASLEYATNAEIDALFGIQPEPTTYTVTYASMDHNITFSDDQAEVEENDPLDLYVVPNQGYRIKEGASMIIMMNDVNIATSAFNTTTGRIYVEHVTGDIRITAINVAEPITPVGNTWSVTYDLTSAINSGVPVTEVEDGASLSVTIEPDGITSIGYRNCNVIMGGDYITSEVVDESTDNTVIYIPSVTGDVTIEVEYQEEEEGEGITALSFDSQNLEVPENGTEDLYSHLIIEGDEESDGLDWLTSNDEIIEVDGGGIVTAHGSVGQSVEATACSMNDPNIFATTTVTIIAANE